MWKTKAKPVVRKIACAADVGMVDANSLVHNPATWKVFFKSGRGFGNSQVNVKFTMVLGNWML